MYLTIKLEEELQTQIRQHLRRLNRDYSIGNVETIISEAVSEYLSVYRMRDTPPLDAVEEEPDNTELWRRAEMKKQGGSGKD
jgi:hypothetical protein